VNVKLILGDYVRTAEGKLDVLGAGWLLTGPEPSTFGIGILFEAYPGEFGRQHSIVLELVDEDGQLVPIPEGDEPMLRVEGQVEVIPPPGHPASLPVVLPLGFNATNVPLPAGRKLEFRLWVDEETAEGWRLPFSTRAEGVPPPPV